MANVLLVDDDEFTRKIAASVLKEANFTTDEAASGQEALDILARQRPDLLVLDIMMPEMDGLELCRRVRADPFLAGLPIVFLTSRERPEDVADCLDAGGDDFVTKARVAYELPARVRALLRRSGGGLLDAEADVLTIGELALDARKPVMTIGSTTHYLTPVQYRLMRYLILHSGQPVSIDQLLADVWGYPPGTGDPKLVRVHIAHLRNKIEPEPDDPRYILNVRGRGYLIAD
jgi:two-component system OmpR family response regulator